MRTLPTIVVMALLSVPFRVGAEITGVGRVVVEVTTSEVRVPGMIGATLQIFDEEGRPIPVHRLPESWNVRFTLNQANVVTELWTRSSGTIIEADLTIRQSGLHHVAARIQEIESGHIVAESEPVGITAVAPLDYGVVRAGDTVCRQLPEGGRGLLGEVVEGELPSSLRLWGACLVAGDAVEEQQGTLRAAVAVLSGSGQGRRVDRRLYDITYHLEPRLMTPRRVFYGFIVLALLGMIAAVSFAVRRRFPAFGPGTALAVAKIEGSPYRGERAGEWEFVDLSTLEGKRGAVDVASLIGRGALKAGALRVRPTGDGLVEFIGTSDEEIHAVTPDNRLEVGRHRLSVPYGSMVTFRNVALTPLLTDE